jgi:hypothetical protein
MSLGAHASSLPKKQLIGCVSKFLKRRWCLWDPLRCHAVHQLWEATLWCMCRVESQVCFWCDRLGHLIKLCPSLAALTQNNSCVIRVECGSYTLIYVVEDLGHVVNMVKETIPQCSRATVKIRFCIFFF